MTWEYPPPVAPPLTPKTGPKDGSLRAITEDLFIFFIACPRPTVIVVFPSPAGVGFTAVTRTNFPFFLFFNFSHNLLSTFALNFP